MTQHLHRAVEHLKEQVLALGELVEESLTQAIRAFLEGDAVAARKTIAADEKIDLFEVEVEEECLKLLALHQPVANDLRFIVAVLKINSDLERIGDFAVSISWSVVERSDLRAALGGLDLTVMIERAQVMVHEALQAVLQLDCGRARAVLKMDDVVDSERRRIQHEVLAEMKRFPERVDALNGVLSISRALERVADHSTNIAEDVIYMVEGDIIRHGRSIDG